MLGLQIKGGWVLQPAGLCSGLGEGWEGMCTL